MGFSLITPIHTFCSFPGEGVNSNFYHRKRHRSVNRSAGLRKRHRSVNRSAGLRKRQKHRPGNILAGAGESFDDKGSDIRIGCRHGHGAEDTVSLTPGDDPDVIADILL